MHPNTHSLLLSPPQDLARSRGWQTSYQAHIYNLAILLSAEEQTYSNALTHFSVNLRNGNLTAQPFHHLQLPRNIPALNLKAVCIWYKYPPAKRAHRSTAQAHAQFHAHPSSQKRGQRGAITPAYY